MIESKSSETTKVTVGDKQVFMVKGVLDKVGLEPFKSVMEPETASFNGDALFLDLSQLEFLNSESIGYLLTLHARLLKQNKKFVLVSAQKNVLDILDTIGLLKIIEHVENINQYK